MTNNQQLTTNNRNITMKKLCIAASSLLLLVACSGGEVKRSLGLEQEAPDEFMVLSRPPLNVPPDFSLRPPGTDMGENGTRTIGEARQAVFASSSSSGGASDAATRELLKNAGADRADPSIRRILTQEHNAQTTPITREPGFFESVKKKLTPQGEPVVDAEKEKDRLKKNKDEGKPLNEGETPVIKPEDKGVLNQILD